MLRLRRKLACRGIPAYLAIVEAGRLEVHACSFGARDAPVLQRDVGDLDAPASIRDLADGACHQEPPILDAEDLRNRRKQRASRSRAGKNVQSADLRSVHDVLLDSINHVAEALTDGQALRAHRSSSEVVLSLIGRCLMARFLIDRGILTSSTFPELWEACGREAPRGCFDTAAAATVTSRWLDRTFNGELLPLGVDADGYEALFASFQSRDPTFFHVLGSLLHQVDARGQLSLPLWKDVDFAHVQVGLLSEVYEDFAHRRSAEAAKRESVHFTPRHIAEIVVSQAFGALDTARDEARVLDPAAGAGVFLAIAFRRLYLARWERRIAEGATRPDTAEIRSILYGQVRGYDVDRGALTLAALSLYLVAIEVDPDPIPPEKLKFALPLLGTVLVHVGDADRDDGVVLGSLGTRTPEADLGAFDMVVGNPPWTSWTGEAGEVMEELGPAIIDRVMRRRSGLVLGSDRITAQNPDRVPDLPFVWRSMEWTRPGGVIGLVLHGRLLFKTRPAAVAARSALLRNVRVTGIVNGAALRFAKSVWPGVTAPFCIVFAYNRVPLPSDEFNYLSPFLESHVNRTGIIRLDPSRTLAISASELESEPTLLKTLFRGDVLDASLMSKLRRGGRIRDVETAREDAASHIEMEPPAPKSSMARAFAWDEVIGPAMTRLGPYLERLRLEGREGFQLGKPEMRTRDARTLRALDGKLLDGRQRIGLVLDSEPLPPFEYDALQWPRTPSIYEPSLLLVREAAKTDEGEPTASLYTGDRSIIYSEAFTGYRFDPGSVDDGEILYIASVINSRVFRYYMLMTSAKYGVERDAWNRVERDRFPLPGFATLDRELRGRFDQQAQALRKGHPPDVDELMDGVRVAYGLDRADRAIMDDTMAVAQPTADCRDMAESRPTRAIVEEYARCLEHMVRPLLGLIGTTVSVRAREGSPGAPSGWCFVDVEVDGHAIDGASMEHLSTIVADDEGCSVIFDRSHPPCIRVGMLAQRRFWLPSRATLTATTILEIIEGSRRTGATR